MSISRLCNDAGYPIDSLSAMGDALMPSNDEPEPTLLSQ
jgi:hypothetical protein